ncbi:nicotinamide/nicotinic acid mononucleotide adenylyltransferase isoform X1 [Cucumis sativus]|uniref:nicotinamide/nicotinic acid mononucleotide adenylyltransferase isoform X1 n=1 Tax=Cucumis sativus TaxID=3659 RepID=UPI0005EC55AA|nr:nicotinamide/nicotinic acid mononucleotide adenylyltransferase isoform X1 [Cucumis sativus]XP_011650482.1 nicotinamide/nicotinic acid mononucleotide adenylyltransferase isoform X1 [Cucumis sativus]XP_011650483.1 nicotinamide/nicotinic acid mononucleotide adenylyltransferase isoform X1 [Cucumis sativus]XP_011650484.1 nicotinamide/nicotinic acid mononucleotide adenylyltransferase isoform X1 [Cucumis sativus]XP_011650485.1 nicotinamide/nicotinic acid mononucleotide adenylyltransferase isoform X
MAASYGQISETVSSMEIPLPVDKLALDLVGHDSSSGPSIKPKMLVVLVATGSFNPPTYMHLRMFELARDALKVEGLCVIGGYMSPVNDAYKKKGLISSEHRIKLCNLACQSSEYVMVDPWEASQNTYQRTLTVLSRVKTSLCDHGLLPKESLKVMLVCGSDLLQSFATPGVWIRDQVKILCRDFGLVCIRREGQDVEKIILDDGILNENRNNIKIVDQIVPNQISSTRIRDCISRGLSIKYLTADEVIEYIREQHLYLNP